MNSKKLTVNTSQKSITQFFFKKNIDDNKKYRTSTTSIKSTETHTVNGSRLSLKRKRSTNVEKVCEVILSDEDGDFIYSEKKCTSKAISEITEQETKRTSIESVCDEWQSPEKKKSCANQVTPSKEDDFQADCHFNGSSSGLKVKVGLLEPEVILIEEETSDIILNSSSSTPTSVKSSCLVSPIRTPTPSPNSCSQHSPQRGTQFSVKKSPRSVRKRAQNTSLFMGSAGPSVRRQILSPEKSPIKSESSPIKNATAKETFRGEKGMYLENFLLIIEFVKSHPEDSRLFNEEDLEKVADFYQLSMQAQKLYVRIFQRQVKWHKYSKIDYKDICDQEDMVIYLNELCYAGFLFSENNLVDTSEALNLLEKKDLSKIAKDFKVKHNGRKEDIIIDLLRIGTEQKTIFSMFKRQPSQCQQLLKKSKEMIGQCFRINKIVRDIFMRFLVLYSLPNFGDDEDDGQQSQLTTLLMIKLGRVKYPSYSIERRYVLYTSRQDLIEFTECQQLEAETRELIAEKKWGDVLANCSISQQKLTAKIADVNLMKHESHLPDFLRKYTTLSILYHVWSYCVEAHQRLGEYEQAVTVLRELLKQQTHLQDSRGRWTDRLALNLEKHLKDTHSALAVIQTGLCDPHIMVGHQLSLSQRAQRILSSKRTQHLSAEFNAMKFVEVIETPKMVIDGDCVLHDSSLGKRLYVSKSPGKSHLISSVEEFVLSYYRSEGYSEGLHQESAVIHVIFGLLFWSCIYHSIPDVFRSPHQAAPLDLNSRHFYESRKAIFDERLHQLSQSSMQHIQLIVEQTWTEHFEELSIVNWSTFRDVEQLKSLLACLGVPLIMAICERLIKNHRFTRSGFPDLIVWKPDECKCSIVEVKGPNDKLSTKQILWIQFLNEHGAEAKVCHVNAKSSKKYLD